jgi:hypothetical protein
MNQTIRATLIGTAAQVAMVVAGHFVPAIAGLFAIGGMGISALAGWGALRGRSAGMGAAAGAGAFAGAVCAVIGIGISVLLGDVPPSLLALGTGSSAVTGLIGGVIGRRR